ncbi:MAG: hypothetical protein JO001_16070, partial [Alphaproteobacteria bacterium]|nr:hypothetical protein [Alphaproteobacteria bacterium]
MLAFLSKFRTTKMADIETLRGRLAAAEAGRDAAKEALADAAYEGALAEDDTLGQAALAELERAEQRVALAEMAVAKQEEIDRQERARHLADARKAQNRAIRGRINTLL